VLRWLTAITYKDLRKPEAGENNSNVFEKKPRVLGGYMLVAPSEIHVVPYSIFAIPKSRRQKVALRRRSRKNHVFWVVINGNAFGPGNGPCNISNTPHYHWSKKRFETFVLKR
jgi:hypothetical protein